MNTDAVILFFVILGVIAFGAWYDKNEKEK